VPGFAAIEIDALTDAVTVIVIAFEVAGLPVAQDELDVSTQVITSPFTGTTEYVGELDPTFDPFFFHWYTGLTPGFTGVAVYVTVVPEHTVLPGFAAIVTLTGCDALTVTTVPADDADKHPFCPTCTV